MPRVRIKMCGVHVDAPAEAFEFYTGVLGFEPLMVVPEADLFIVRSPEDRDGVGLLLEPSDNPVARAYREGVRAQGLPVIVFGCPDVRAEHDRLVAAGVVFTSPPTTDASGTTAVFDDTCGNLVLIHQD